MGMKEAGVDRQDCGDRVGQSCQHGFAYIALLIFIAVMSVALSAVAEVWHMALKREKEEELLFIGHQFRDALAMYYRSAGPGARFPMSLEDLVKDPRYPNTRRYLRKLFFDPMTNRADWGVVKGPAGEILGVYSRSEDEPVKKANFGLFDKAFEGKQKYSEWVFMSPAANVLAPQNFLGPQSVQQVGGVAPGMTNPSSAPQRRMSP